MKIKLPKELSIDKVVKLLEDEQFFYVPVNEPTFVYTESDGMRYIYELQDNTYRRCCQYKLKLD